MARNKKDFSAAATQAAGELYSTIADATAEPQETQQTHKERKTYTEQEAQEFKKTLHTGGRKGVKLPRINMAFTADNYDFLQTMARVRGQTMTQFVNDIVSNQRELHAETYAKAIDFLNSL